MTTTKKIAKEYIKEEIRKKFDVSLLKKANI
jgi:hypothetical protein